MIEMNTKTSKTVHKVEDLYKALTEVNIPSFLDNWGPEHVIQVYDPVLNMHGFLVIDNTALGPGHGGICISPTITLLEMFRLARMMTWKCALAKIPFGGARSGIRADPSDIDKIQYIQSFAKKIAPYSTSKYVAGPDEDIAEKEIDAFVETVGDLQAAIGKPERLGGIPPWLGAAGFGVGVALETGLELIHDLVDLPDDLSETRVAIQGFGIIGRTTAKYLCNKGAKIVALSDCWGAIYNSKGIIPAKMDQQSSTTSGEHSVKYYDDPGCQRLKSGEIFGVDCDIFVKCSYNDTMSPDIRLAPKAKYVIKAANGIFRTDADQGLYDKGAIVLPDLLANSGGVIAAYAEQKRMDVGEAFSLIESRVRKNTEIVLQRSIKTGLCPQHIAIKIAKERVREAMEKRRND